MEQQIAIEVVYQKLLNRLGEVVTKYENEMAIRDAIIEDLHEKLAAVTSDVENVKEAPEEEEYTQEDVGGTD